MTNEAATLPFQLGFHPSAELVRRMRRALRMNAEKFGRLAHSSRRTVQRWESGGGYITNVGVAALIRALYPVDRALAAEVAAKVKTSFAALGLEVAPVAATVAPAHLVDSVVCAAADAGGVTTAAVRPALHAALVRARELGLDPAALERLLVAGARTTA